MSSLLGVRTLYFKIFLWFWLAMALVGVAFVVSTVTLQGAEAEARWRAFVASGLTLSGQSAIDAYRVRGADGLADYLDRMERQRNIRVYLYDQSLQELSGRPTPSGSVDLVTRAAASDELVVQEFEDSRLVALSLAAADGQTFVLLADLERPFRGRGRDRFDGDRRRGDAALRQGRGAEDTAPGDMTDRRGGRVGGAARPDAEGTGAPFRRVGPREPQPWYGVWLAAIDQPGALALRMAAVLLTAGLLCYGLARYLTAPVLRLRDATHKLAGGDLSVRVGPEVGGRRDELAELGRDFDLMAERIESLLTAQRQLLSDVSHELRSPLARLNVALALARRRSGPEAEAPLDRIETEAEQLNALIGRVLTLARFETGAVEAEFVELDIVQLVEDVAADADFEADPRDVSVVVAAAQPAPVNGNESLLRSAVENVVRNAVRYTAPGSRVEIAVARTDAPPADRAATPGEVVVTVRDHGPGVPAERLADLFKPFYRLADARDRQSGGTGLGLAITERAVRLHGGTVAASNAPDGGGLVVEIRLPIVGRA